jgi:fibronectin-binding autotransporter adhesin
VSGSVNAGGITFGALSGTARYTVTGGTIGLADGATISLSGSYGQNLSGLTGITQASVVNSVLVAKNLTVAPRAGEANITALTLGGSNSLTGSLTISSSAALKVNSSNALNGNADVTVASGGAIEISSTGTYANNFLLSGTGVGIGALRFNAAATLTGTVTLAADVQFNPANNIDGVKGPIVIANGIAETAGSAKSLNLQGIMRDANAVFVLRGASTYSGATTIGSGVRVQLEGGDNRLPAGTTLTMSGGSLILGGTTFGAMSQELAGLIGSSTSTIRGGASGISTLVVNNSGSATFGQTLGGTGAFDNNFGITKKGNGTFTLAYNAALPATYSGPTQVLEGTWSAGKISNNSPITVSSGATFNFAHSSGNFGGPITTTISGSGAVTVTSGTLTLASNNTFAGSFSNSATTFLTGSNTFTGTTELAAGTLEVGNQFALGGGGDIRFSGGALRFSGSGMPDVAAQVKNSGSAMSFDTNGQSMTFGSSLGASNTGGLTKLGSGTLSLVGNNSYAGTTTISAGVLRVGGSGTAFGTGTVSMGTTAGATLDINGFTQSIAALTGGTTTGGSININSGTLAVGFANTSTAYSGNFAGTAGTLAKQGLGILTLNGTSSVLAGVALQSGQLLVSPVAGSTYSLGTISRTAGSSLSLQPGTGTITVDAGTSVSGGMIGPWAVTGTATNLTYATQTSGTIGSYTASGTAANAANLPNNASANVLLQSGAGTVPSTVSANTIRLTANGATTSIPSSSSFTVNGLMNAGGGDWTISSGTITIGSAGELVVATNNRNVSIGSVIRESGTVAGLTFISQGGLLTLNAATANSFSGPINVVGGGLFLNASGTYGAVNLSGTTSLTAILSGAQRIGSITGVGSSFTKQGTGTTSLLDTSSYTGATSIQGGVVEIASISTIGTAGGLGNPTATSGTISIGNTTTAATLRYVGSGNSTTNRPINMAGTTGGAALDGSGAGSITFTSDLIAGGAGSKTFTLTGTSTAANTFSGVIPDANTGAGQLTSVTKTGAGRWVLSGSSSYTGAFNLDNGTLVAGANAPQSGNGVFGSTSQVALPTIGSTGSTTTGTASLLVRAGVGINRDLSIAAASGSQVVVLGGADLSGTATFGAVSSPANVRVGRPLTLAAAGSGTTVGTVRFLNTWSNLDNTGSPTQSFTIGTAESRGVVSLGNNLTTSGSVTVAFGKLNLESGRTLQPTAGPLTIDSSASLGGVGTVSGTLAGGGRIGPGNSPGILTATSLDPGQLIFDFEFTAIGAPNYSSVTASSNDVLRLTGTSPFVSALTSSNIVNVYFDMASVGNGDTFQGGFFTDQQADFFSSISGATFNYFIRDTLGGTSYNGVQYSPFASPVSVSTVASGPSFNGGSVEGRITQFSVIVVPEPGTLALLAVGAALAGSRALRRRRK